MKRCISNDSEFVTRGRFHQRQALRKSVSAHLYADLIVSMRKKAPLQCDQVSRPHPDPSGIADFSFIIDSGNDARLTKFLVNATLNTLATASRRSWLFGSSEVCKLCDKNLPQTVAHVLGNCPYSLAVAPATFNRYLWRHNLVLKSLVNALLKHGKNRSLIIFSDLPDHASKYDPSNPPFNVALHGEFRPDMLIGDDNGNVIIGELSVPMEHLAAARHQQKFLKYQALIDKLPNDSHGSVIAFEVCSDNGMVCPSLNPLLELFMVNKRVQKIIKKELQIVALRASARIFSARDQRDWLG